MNIVHLYIAQRDSFLGQQRQELAERAKTFSYHVVREAAPLYVMGSINPRSFSMGRRNPISGTLTFSTEVLSGRHFKELYVDTSYQVRSVTLMDGTIVFIEGLHVVEYGINSEDTEFYITFVCERVNLELPNQPTYSPYMEG